MLESYVIRRGFLFEIMQNLVIYTVFIFSLNTLT